MFKISFALALFLVITPSHQERYKCTNNSGCVKAAHCIKYSFYTMCVGNNCKTDSDCEGSYFCKKKYGQSYCWGKKCHKNTDCYPDGSVSCLDYRCSKYKNR